jgi:hypothetical protein
MSVIVAGPALPAWFRRPTNVADSAFMALACREANEVIRFATDFAAEPSVLTARLRSDGREVTALEFPWPTSSELEKAGTLASSEPARKRS